MEKGSLKSKSPLPYGKQKMAYRWPRPAVKWRLAKPRFTGGRRNSLAWASPNYAA